MRTRLSCRWGCSEAASALLLAPLFEAVTLVPLALRGGKTSAIGIGASASADTKPLFKSASSAGPFPLFFAVWLAPSLESRLLLVDPNNPACDFFFLRNDILADGRRVSFAARCDTHAARRANTNVARATTLLR